MKVRNEYINIKIGQRNFKKHNFFLNRYLKLFSKCQLNGHSTDNFYKLFDRVYLKFDNPLEDINYNSILSSNDFDYILLDLKNNFSYTKSTIIANYRVGFYPPPELINHKIVGIAFGSVDGEVYTYLDTRDYNMIIYEGEIIEFTRRDVISIDGKLNGYNLPLHLKPLDRMKDEKYAKLYSVSLSSTVDSCQEEYVIGVDIEAREIDDFTFGFVLTKGTDEGIYPGSNFYPSEIIHSTTFGAKLSIFPRENLYCEEELYPNVSDLRYVVYKYRIYDISFDRFTGEEYTVSVYVPTKGIFEIQTKIIRE